MTRNSRLSRLDFESLRKPRQSDVDSLVIAMRDDVIIAGRLEDVCRETRGRDATREIVEAESIHYSIDA